MQELHRALRTASSRPMSSAASTPRQTSASASSAVLRVPAPDAETHRCHRVLVIAEDYLDLSDPQDTVRATRCSPSASTRPVRPRCLDCHALFIPKRASSPTAPPSDIPKKKSSRHPPKPKSADGRTQWIWQKSVPDHQMSIKPSHQPPVVSQQTGGGLKTDTSAFAVLYDRNIQEELKQMASTSPDKELLQTPSARQRPLLSRMPVMRLDGIQPKPDLEGIAPEDRLKDWKQGHLARGQC